MSFLFTLIFKIIFVAITLGYPASQALKSIRENKPNRLYITYFFIMGIFIVLQSTIFFPIKWLLSLISSKLYMVLTSLMSLWLIHPEYRGALLLNDKIYPVLFKHMKIANEKCSKVFSIIGVPNRDVQKDNQKSQ